MVTAMGFSIGEQYFIVGLFSVITFSCLRDFLSGEIVYQMSYRAFRRKKKGQTLKEWFLYSRFREEIPRGFLTFYFVVIAIHLVILIALFILYLTISSNYPGTCLTYPIFPFDGLWMLIIRLLFLQAKKPGYKYERWIYRRRGNRKK